MEKNKPCVCLDFDGVIHAYVKWTGATDIPNPPVDGISDFMRTLKERGYDIAVCSSRASTCDGRFAIIQWLKKYDPSRMWMTMAFRSQEISAPLWNLLRT